MSRKLGLPVKPERDFNEEIFPNYSGDLGRRVLVGAHRLTMVDEEVSSIDSDRMPPGYLEGHRGGAAMRLLEGFQDTHVGLEEADTEVEAALRF